MKSYLFKRLGWGLAGLLVITCINFLIIKLVPGDPVRAIVGDYPVPAEYIAKIRADYGLDQPIHRQFLNYLSAVIQGDLGFSFANRHDVLPLVLEKAKFTLMLIVPSILISLVVGVVLALVSARKIGGVVDTSSSTIAVLGYSIPAFWLGQMAILFFAVTLAWLPSSGFQSVRKSYQGLDHVLDVIRHMVLPIACIVSYKLAVFLRVARASVIGVMRDDYVHTARAKGMAEWQITLFHTLPNAMIPIIAVIGYQFGHALTSSILVETVFAWPGIGSLFVSSITNRDFPVLQAILILSTAIVIIANLFADLASALVDPRIRRNLGARHV